MAFKHLLIFAVLALLVTLANLSEAAPKPLLPIAIVNGGPPQNTPDGNNGASTSQTPQTTQTSTQTSTQSQSQSIATSTTSASGSTSTPTITASTNSTSGSSSSTTSGTISTTSGSSTTTTPSTKGTPATQPSKGEKGARSTAVVIVSAPTPNSTADDSSDASIGYSTNLVTVLFMLIASFVILT